MADSILVTCEHGGNRVPREYRHLFQAMGAQLKTHRGYDPGALRMAGDIAASLKASLVTATITRLLVDLNRSVGNPTLHSDATRGLSGEQRLEIIASFYAPYRTEVERKVVRAIHRGRRVLHLSSHSFTPEMDGEVRAADIGLLYDPRRPGETRFCALWKASLAAVLPGMQIRRNYPYAGRNDGLTAALRRRFDASDYVGIELEINQRHIIGAGSRWTALRAAVVASLRGALVSWHRPS